MPCTITGSLAGDAELSHQKTQKELEQVEAILCGILTCFEKNGIAAEVFLSPIDWDEVGVTKQAAISWWVKHQERDRRRKAQ